jgi:hypothetical protein
LLPVKGIVQQFGDFNIDMVSRAISLGYLLAENGDTKVIDVIEGIEAQMSRVLGLVLDQAEDQYYVTWSACREKMADVRNVIYTSVHEADRSTGDDIFKVTLRNGLYELKRALNYI